MTDQERIKRLERMVKTLTETVQRLLSVVNTGNYEYNLRDIDTALTDVPEFTYERESEKPFEQEYPAIDAYLENERKLRPKPPACAGEWHTAVMKAEPWCSICGRSV